MDPSPRASHHDLVDTDVSAWAMEEERLRSSLEGVGSWGRVGQGGGLRKIEDCRNHVIRSDKESAYGGNRYQRHLLSCQVPLYERDGSTCLWLSPKSSAPHCRRRCAFFARAESLTLESFILLPRNF